MAAGLFGTDGVRGPVGTVLTAKLAENIGRAAVATIPTAGASASAASRPQVLVLRDTRESGPMLEDALAKGASEAGADVLLAGVLPTPAAPLLTLQYGFELAVVISASHNPYEDNGIKIFGPDGRKLPDAQQAQIEELVASYEEAAEVQVTPVPENLDAPEGNGLVQPLLAAEEDLLRILDQRFAELDLSGKKIALDCANGSAFSVGPQAFRRRGAEVVLMATEPDGRNINDGVGSTAPAALAALTKEHGCDAGFAFDGDADRAMAAAADGTIIDGDGLLATIALDRKRRGTLKGGVVVTVMTNYGFHVAMKEAEIPVVASAVGDRYVTAALDENAWTLGGEQSGHLIDTDLAPSGDGIATALLVMEALGANGKLGDPAPFQSLPQKLINVPVKDRDQAQADPRLLAEVQAVEAQLAGQGRVLVRASGTEQLIRVMVEAPTQPAADAACQRLADVAASLG